jgi:hypothetical protein
MVRQESTIRKSLVSQKTLDKMNGKKVAIILLIVVAIMIVIYLMHMAKIRDSKSQGGRVFVHGTYVIDVRPTSQESRGSSEQNAFYINDLERPPLVLKRGVYYEFQNPTDEPLYFTTDRSGGPGAPGSLAKNQKKGFSGLSKGTIFFLITEDLPDRFYYQSGKTAGLGGTVEIIP